MSKSPKKDGPKKPRTAKPKPFKAAAEKAGIVEKPKSRAKPEIIQGRGVDTMGGHKVTTTKQVQEIAAVLTNLRKDSRSAADAIRDALAKAEETRHLDKKAFMMAFKLHQMSDTQLARHWDTFLKYCDDLKIPDRATAQGDLLKATKAADDELAGQTDIEDAAERDVGDAKEAADGLSPGRKSSHGMRVIPGGAMSAAAAPDK